MGGETFGYGWIGGVAYGGVFGGGGLNGLVALFDIFVGAGLIFVASVDAAGVGIDRADYVLGKFACFLEK